MLRVVHWRRWREHLMFSHSTIKGSDEKRVVPRSKAISTAAHTSTAPKAAAMHELMPEGTVLSLLLCCSAQCMWLGNICKCNSRSSVEAFVHQLYICISVSDTVRGQDCVFPFLTPYRVSDTTRYQTFSTWICVSIENACPKKKSRQKRRKNTIWLKIYICWLFTQNFTSCRGTGSGYVRHGPNPFGHTYRGRHPKLDVQVWYFHSKAYFPPRDSRTMLLKWWRNHKAIGPK